MLSLFLLVNRNSPSLLLSHTHPGGKSLGNYCTLPSKWNRKNTPESSGFFWLVFLEGNLKPVQTPARRLLLLANESFSSQERLAKNRHCELDRANSDFKLLVVTCVSLRRTDPILVTLRRHSLGEIVLPWSQSQKWCKISCFINTDNLQH